MNRAKMRSGSKRYYWMRLKTDFFDQPEIKKLRKLAGGDTYTIIYLKMMLKTLSNGGMFTYQGLEDSFEKEIALIIDEDENNVMMTISYLRTHNLLEEGYEDNEYLLNAVPELIGSETRDAERKRIARSMDSKEQKIVEISDGSDIVRQLSANVHICPAEKEQEQEIETDIEKDSDSVREDSETETYEQYETCFLRTLNKEQYNAWESLLKKMQIGRLRTTRANLTRYFEQMQRREWKDFSGRPIRNIVSYVEMNFAANARDRDIAEEKLLEEGFEPGSIFVPNRKR